MNPTGLGPITASGAPRGYIDAHALEELWFHTGTACNLQCPFCLEGSGPGDRRLQRMRLQDVQPFIDEAMALGVRQFSFTGGEPFIVRDIVRILSYAAERRPCLVLTNGTEPLLRRLHQLAPLRHAAQPVSFRISIDFPDEQVHEAGRGAGSFRRALEALQRLYELGFPVSIARQMRPGENEPAIETQFRQILRSLRLPEDTRIVKFPDFGRPGDRPAVPEITEECMRRYQTEQTRRAFMCAFSRMVVKIAGQMRVYACTLVDDDPDYDLGSSLRQAVRRRVHLGHHRCYACFRYGSSCSELAAAPPAGAAISPPARRAGGVT